MARETHLADCPRAPHVQRMLSAQDCSFCEVAERAYERGKRDQIREDDIERARRTYHLTSIRLEDDPENSTLRRIRLRALSTLESLGAKP